MTYIKQIILLFSFLIIGGASFSQSSSEVSYISPKENQFVAKNTVFHWNKLDTIATYNLLISNDSLFQSVYLDSILSGNMLAVNVKRGKSFWKVMAFKNNRITDSSKTSYFNHYLPFYSDSLGLWLLGDSGVTIDGGKVSQWQDQSSLGTVLTQNNPLLRPLLNSGKLNNHDVIDIDNDVFSNIYNLTNSSYYVGAVYNFHDNPRGSRLIATALSTNWVIGPYLKHSIGNGIGLQGPGVPIVKNEFVLNAVHLLNDTLRHNVNNNLITQAGKGKIPGVLNIGIPHVEPMDGELAEVILFDGQVSYQEIDSVEKYILDKYAPPVNLGENIIACNFPFELDAYNNFYRSFLWSTGSTDSSISINSPGIYVISVIDIFGRNSTDSILITTNTTEFTGDLPKDTTLCLGDSIVVNLQGLDNFTYEWGDSFFGKSRTIKQGGQYTLKVTDCINRIVRDTFNLALFDFNFSLGQDSSLCFYNDFEIKPDTFFADVNYSWNTGFVDSSILVNSTGEYILTISNSNGCFYKDSIQVDFDSTLINSTLGNDLTICAGNEIGLLEPIINATYLWSTGETDSIIKVDTTGVYNLEVSINNCIFKDTIGIIIKGNAPIADFNFINTCNGDTTIFNDNSTDPNNISISSFKWRFNVVDSSSIQNPKFLFDSISNYTVLLQIENDSGCTNQISKTVIINPKPIINFTTAISCQDDSTVFINQSTIESGTIPQFNWVYYLNNLFNSSSNLDSPIVTFNKDTTYLAKLIATSNKGCIDSISKNFIVNSKPVADYIFNRPFINDSTFFINRSSINQGKIDSNYWDFDNSEFSKLINPKVSFDSLRKFNVSLYVVSDSGCTSVFSDSVEIIVEPPPVPQFNTIYPNSGLLLDTLKYFKWNRLDSLNLYRIQYSKDNFTTIEFDSIVQNNTIKHFLSKSGDYYWRVLAINNNQIVDTTNLDSFKIFTPSELGEVDVWINGGSANYDVNGFVTSWLNKIDTNQKFIQANINDRPKVLLDEFNNHPVVYFDSTRDVFPNLFNVTSSNYYIASLYNFREQIVRGSRLVTSASFSTNWVLGPYLRHTLGNGIGFIGSGLPIVKDKYVLNSAYSVNDSVSQYVNNNLLHKSIRGNIPGIIDLGSNTIEFMFGNVAEVLIINDSISKQDRGNISNYLMNKYSPPFTSLEDMRVCSFPDSISLDIDQSSSVLWSNGDTTSKLVVNSPGLYIAEVQDNFGRVYIDSMFFILDTFNFKNVLPIDTINSCEGSRVILNAGSANYKYNWNNGDTLSTVNIDSSFNYKVSIRNCNNQVITDSVYVKFNSPVFSLPNDTSICFNEVFILDPQLNNTSFNYLWSTGETSSSIVVDTTNIYSLVIKDQYNCTFKDSISITVDSSLYNLSIGADTNLCRGNQIGLINPILGINSYQWSNGPTTPNITLDSSSNYVLTILKSGCTVSDSAVINILGNAPIVDFLSTNFCLNDTVSFSDLSSASSGDTLKKWEWNFGDGSIDSIQNTLHQFPGVNTFNVLLKVTTDKGCSDTINKNVEIFPNPVSDFSISNHCSKSEIDFYDLSHVASGAIAGYSWQFGDSTSSSNNSNLQNPSHVYDTLGSYSIRLAIETNNGCKDTLYKQKLIDPSPAVDFDYTGTCLGDSTIFNDQTILPTGSIKNYLWGFNWLPDTSGNLIRIISEPKVVFPIAKDIKVSLRVESDSGCQATKRDTFNINNSPKANFTVGDNCINSNFLVNNTSSITGDSIVLNRFIFRSDTLLLENPIFASDSVGNYPMSLHVESSNGCSDSITKNVSINSLPIPNFRILNNNTGIPFSLNLQNNSSVSQNYIWSFGNGDTLHGLLPNYTYTDTGSYSIKLKAISNNGCVDSISKVANVLPYFLDAALGKVVLSENSSGYLNVGVQILNTGNNSIEQVGLVADLNSEFQFQETHVESIFSGTQSAYQFVSSFIQKPGRKVNFVCVKIESVNGIMDGVRSNDYLCEKGFNEELFLDLYPNPTSGSVNMEYVLPENGDLVFNLYDQMGRSVMPEINKRQEKGVYFIQLNIESLKAGIYHYEFRFEGILRSGTFVKQ